MVFKAPPATEIAAETPPLSFPDVPPGPPEPRAGKVVRQSEVPCNRKQQENHRKTIGKWRFTLWLCQNSYWKWQFIVDFPMKNGDFPVRYVSLPEATYHILLAHFLGNIPRKYGLEYGIVAF